MSLLDGPAPSPTSPAAGGLRMRNTTREDDNTTAAAPLRQQVEAAVRKLKVLDIYPKMEEEYSVQTNIGAAISIVSGIIMLLLFISELSSYLTVNTTEHIVVDTRNGQKLQINFNITFPDLRCSSVLFDVMDVSGDQQVDASTDTYRQRMDRDGRFIGPAYLDAHDGNAPLDMYGEGCTTWGSLEVNKVAGNVHIALGSTHRNGRSAQHVHKFDYADIPRFNSSHIINYLSFGKLYPDMVNPLDGVTRMAKSPAHFQYFVKVVPTIFVATSGHMINTNQFSVTEQTHELSGIPGQMDAQQIPGVFIIYDISPFMVRVEASRMPFSRFLTSLCAIIGGVFTIAGLIDSVLYHGDMYVKRQMRNKSTAS